MFPHSLWSAFKGQLQQSLNRTQIRKVLQYNLSITKVHVLPHVGRMQYPRNTNDIISPDPAFTQPTNHSPHPESSEESANRLAEAEKGSHKPHSSHVQHTRRHILSLDV
jgi:hypothetical protein